MGSALAVLRDLRKLRAPVDPEEFVELETDVLAGFVLVRATCRRHVLAPMSCTEEGASVVGTADVADGAF